MSTLGREKNKKSIRAYCTVLRVAGWVLMVGGVFSAVISAMHRTDARMMIYLILPAVVVGGLFQGVFALGLAQLITYIFDCEYKPGWLLRSADKIIYLYATLVLLQSVLPYFYAFHLSGWWEIPLVMLSLAVKLVILIGLGRLLRLVMPMIEESRTLV